MATIIERILKLAEDRNIRKAELYKACGIPQSSFSTWMGSNIDSIPSQYVVNIARFFNVSCDELLTGEKPRVDLTESQIHLLNGFDSLDWDGQQMVLAAMVTEKRRMEKMEGK